VLGLIQLCQGSIFAAQTEVYVNPVNCVGISGAGLAKTFKEHFPENYKRYHSWCLSGLMHPGEVCIYFNPGMGYPRFIFNFPTKLHWKDPSRLDYIESGMHDLMAKVQILRIGSIAVPAMGCGLGQLSWDEVQPILRKYFKQNSSLKVLLYPPQR
jgi:O-acetyl-ADP-ribose deacetylase (regulator of RNase III)